MKTFFVTQDTNLKDFTDAVYPQGSFCFSALLRAKDIKINGVRTGRSVGLKAGDEVVYYTNAKQEAMPSHRLVYADENVYIADKFSGVSSEGLLCELASKGEFYAVHRLDRNTQGLLVFAKNASAKEELDLAFRLRKAEKSYIALCKNNFSKKSDTLKAYLKKDENAVLVRISDVKERGYDEIVTGYEVVREAGDIALVTVFLYTGKTHQIRAHLAHKGCPVLGDEKYGDRALNAKYGVRRQRLIAKKLIFHLDGSLSYLNGKVFESAFGFSEDLNGIFK